MLELLPKSIVLKYPSGSTKVKIDEVNQRIKINQFTGAAAEMVNQLKDLSQNYKIGKIIFIASEKQVSALHALDFVTEARIDCFFKGETGFYLSKFLSEHRLKSEKIDAEEKVINKAEEYKGHSKKTGLPEGFILRNALPDDAEEMARVYDLVFQTYPTPMNNADYIRKAMHSDIIFKVVTHNSKIISAASADLDFMNLNAEITDCATLCDYRGYGLMAVLIDELEKDLKARNFIMAYTIARAISYGMNIVFAKLNYNYTGRLINNCHICGQFEDMNIWVKTLDSK